MKQSKRFQVLALLMFALLVFTACGKDDTEQNQASGNSEKIKVVTSFYPIYFLANEIGGDAVEVTNLISSGVEPHNWSPKSKDLLLASNADLLLYHGVGFETWIDSFQKGLDKNSKVTVKAVSQGIALIDTSQQEKQDEHTHDNHAHDDHAHGEHADDEHADDEHADAEHAHDEHAHDEADHGHSHTIDPHTWVSPKSAIKLAENIKLALVEISPEHEQVFNENYSELAKKINALDEKYEQELEKLSKRHFVVSHQSFGYVARDYNLEQISIMGLNPNSEPRAQDIMYIADLVKQYDVNYIFFEELVNDNLAKMLASEAKVDTMMLHSLEGLTTKQEKQGENYLSLMELNLQNLISALQ